MSNSKILAFDLYGTLLEEGSVANGLRDHLPGTPEDTIQKAAQAWLRYQFEYMLRLNSMGNTIPSLFLSLSLSPPFPLTQLKFQASSKTTTT